mgnify:FL=1
MKYWKLIWLLQDICSAWKINDKYIVLKLKSILTPKLMTPVEEVKLAILSIKR